VELSQEIPQEESFEQQGELTQVVHTQSHELRGREAQ